MLVVAALLAALLSIARGLPRSSGGYILAVLIGVVTMFIAASVAEWLVHRYIYHRRVVPGLQRIYAIHEQGHHHAIFPTWRYTTNGSPHRHPILSSSVSELHSTADFFVRVHDAIHYPATNSFLRPQGWFQFLARHHYIHHVDTSANINFLLPFGDLIFGTLRRSLTAAEIDRHGTISEATAAPVGWSEPAIEVAVPRARMQA